MDWSLGCYEHTAARLLPAARVVVDLARLAGGERVLDVGCGTGNGSLLAAARGCQVTGVDPARRLLEVARQQAAARGLEVTFVQGDAASLPLPDASADVVLSVFAVIFAPDAAVAAAEMARVCAARGRIVLSAWIPEGPIHDYVRVFQGATGEQGATSEAGQPGAAQPGGAQPFAWHDRDVLAELLRPHGFAVDVEERRLAFTDTSARDYAEGESRHHPLAVAGRAALERSGQTQAVFERALEVLEAGNENPDGFRVTSRYVVATARRG